jgi:uncharacterized OsmC-like protein
MGVDPERARRALEKAEQNCLIANSLKAPIQMLSVVEVSGVGALTRAGA